MAYLTLAAFVVLVIGLTWLSCRRRQSIGCCAAPDPRDDLRMRAAWDAGMDETDPAFRRNECRRRQDEPRDVTAIPSAGW